MGGGLDLIRQLITDSLIKYYRGVLHNASVKIHQLMLSEDRYERLRDYPLGMSVSEANSSRLALLVILSGIDLVV